MTLAACGKQVEFPVPAGIQTIKGVLQPVPFSLKRRGTHAILGPDGKLFSYAESREVHLGTLEGIEVTMIGSFEKNTDASLPPVLIIQKIEGMAHEGSRPWIIPALALSLDLPRSWKGTIRGATAEFTASGSTVQMLTIIRHRTANAGPRPLYGPLPVIESPSSSSSVAGDVFVVGLRRASALFSDDRRSWAVSVGDGAQGAGDETVFSFALRADLSSELQIAAFRNILGTVTFHGVAAGVSSASVFRASSAGPVRQSGGSAGSAAAGSRAAGEGAPCGGTAGILCPKGLYCRIASPADDSGVCVRT